jgi:hypothetical protein
MGSIKLLQGSKKYQHDDDDDDEDNTNIQGYI